MSGVTGEDEAREARQRMRITDVGPFSVVMEKGSAPLGPHDRHPLPRPPSLSAIRSRISSRAGSKGVRRSGGAPSIVARSPYFGKRGNRSLYRPDKLRCS